MGSRPREVLSDAEAAVLRAKIAEHGAEALAKAIGVDRRTLYRACAQDTIHRLTASVIRSARL
jgi:hypothetical protein